MPTLLFAVIWLLVAGWNMWIGVTQAGSSFMEELPIFILISAVPVLCAVAAKYKFWP